MKKWLLALLLLLPLSALGDGQLTLPKNLKPYSENAIVYQAQADGILDLCVESDGRTYAVFSDLSVKTGGNELTWDALLPGGEPLRRGTVTLRARFHGAGGTHTEELSVRVLPPAGALQYALPASKEVCQGESFEIDYLLTAPGDVDVQLQNSAGDIVRTWRLKVKNTLPRLFRWDGNIGRAAAPAGEYVFTLSTAASDREPLHVPVTVLADSKPQAAIAISDKYLPSDMQDVPAYLEAPLVVVDIGARDHQEIYQEASSSAFVLGTVHGQTAGLKVLGFFRDFARVGAWRHEDGAYVEGYVPLERLKTVTPQPGHALVIDKAAQTMTIYKDHAVLGTVRVSTGLAGPDTLFWETHAGAFLVEERIGAFDEEGFYYEYPIRIDGGNLIHQVGCKTRGGQADFAEQTARLGQKASHGCVRVDRDGEYNMFWLWTHIPRGTKVLVLDDAVPAPAPDTARASLPQTAVTLTFGGDAVLGSDWQAHGHEDSFDAFIAQKGPAWPFSGLQEIFENDDLTQVNLEGVLKDDTNGYAQRLHNFRGLPQYAKCLTLGSVEAVTVANNHHIDFGKEGQQSTLKALEAEGVRFSGYRHLDIFEKDGVRIGFGGIRETIWRQDPGRTEQEIAELRSAGCDFVVYNVHFGEEYSPTHNALQTKIAHAAIDAGADLVVGAHPHVVQGVERYKSGVILYSLGNLVFGGNRDLTEFDAVLARVTLFYSAGAWKEMRLELIPVVTSGTAPANDFRPVPAQGERKETILQKVQDDTAFVLAPEMTFRR